MDETTIYVVGMVGFVISVGAFISEIYSRALESTRENARVNEATFTRSSTVPTYARPASRRRR